jgi:hypothetical protein
VAEVVEAHIHRIEQVDLALNAVVVLRGTNLSEGQQAAAHLGLRFVRREHIRARVCRCRYTWEPGGPHPG